MGCSLRSLGSGVWAAVMLGGFAQASPSAIDDLSRGWAYEENTGAWPADARFVARVGPRVVVLRENGFDLRDRGVGPVRFEFVGASSGGELSGELELPGRVHYFHGRPESWVRDVSRFARVRYPSLYPGVDVVFHSRRDLPEQDIVVAPGSDPAQVRIVVAGAARVKLDDGGDLEVTPRGGTGRPFRLLRPVAYQQDPQTRTPLGARYVLLDGDLPTVGFEVDPYDRTRPLVIDPVLQFSTLLGVDGAEDAVYAVAAGQDGSIYAAGVTTSLLFPVSAGAFQDTLSNAAPGFVPRDAFVMRFAPDGQLVYATYFGGAGDDAAYAMALDGAGNAYITGTTASPDLPTTPGALLPGCASGPYGCLDSAYVAKIAPGGDELVYGTYVSAGYNPEISTAPFDEAYGIVVDAEGRAYVGGSTAGMHLPGTEDAFQPSPAVPGSRDGFVLALDPAGAEVLWGTYLGGSGSESLWCLARDAYGYLYAGGNTSSDDFPTVNAFQPAPRDSDYANEGFVTKLAPDGRSALYSTYFGGNNLDSVLGIAVDAQGQAAITGQTKSIDLRLVRPLQGPNWMTSTLGDGYVALFSADGRSLRFSTYLGGTAFDYGTAAAFDGAGRLHAALSTNSADAPRTPDAYMVLPGINFDAYLAILESDGALTYATYLGGSTNDEAWALALDPLGRDVLGGFATSQNFPLAHAVQTKGYGLDGFVSVLDSGSPVVRLSGATSPWSPLTGAGTISTSPPGEFNCPARCEWNYDRGTGLTLLATPDAISYFVGWSGSCGGKGACTLTMDDARIVFAAFAPADPDTDGDGIADGSDNCVVDQNPGQADADGDDWGDVCDCAPASPALSAPPPEVLGLKFTDGRTLAWSPAADAAKHEVYRESLGHGPIGTTGEAACLVSGLVAATFQDAQDPLPGAGFRYLLRGRNRCGGGTWGHASSGAERGAPACP